MDNKAIKELIDLLKENQLSKISYTKGDLKIKVEQQLSSSPIPVMQPIVSEESVNADNHTYIESPMVGTYYASSSPDLPSFVKVGDHVEANSIVCIIEAMKVMNEVKASKSGVIKEILLENGQTVEFGSKLFRIE